MKKLIKDNKLIKQNYKDNAGDQVINTSQENANNRNSKNKYNHKMKFQNVNGKQQGHS